MRYRRQVIRKINVLLKQFFVKSYNDSIKTLKFIKKFFFNFKFSRENSKSSFLFESFVFKTNRFCSIIFNFVFSNFEFRNKKKKKRQLLTSFFNIINRDFLIFQIIFVLITIIESKNFYFNNEN